MNARPPERDVRSFLAHQDMCATAHCSESDGNHPFEVNKGEETHGQLGRTTARKPCFRLNIDPQIIALWKKGSILDDKVECFPRCGWRPNARKIGEARSERNKDMGMQIREGKKRAAPNK